MDAGCAGRERECVDSKMQCRCGLEISTDERLGPKVASYCLSCNWFICFGCATSVPWKHEHKTVAVISERKPQGCDFCGQVRELRPYGPKGEWICFECGMKNQEAAIRRFAGRMGVNPSKRQVARAIEETRKFLGGK